ncbi:MAG: cyclase family protein [Alphaproteobacteria bacterium]|nr:cyclase family protein [Alphaproteobacteria bacterium]MCB9928308.1 cyclase family protein [Alphaproteobacteria bacterium]
MARKLIDISIPLTNAIVCDPPHMRPQIQYMNHHDTAAQMAEYMGVKVEDLPEGEYAAVEKVTISTHNGTHLDAPYHFFSRMNEGITPGGEPSATIDQIALDWCYRPAVKLDFRHFDDGYVATPGDVQAELKRIGHALQPLDIVLVNTGAGAHFGQDDFIDRGCGVGYEATCWLLDQGVRVTGTDGWSWDAPFSWTREKIKAGGSPKLIWEGHRAGRYKGYCHLEKLWRLDRLPANGFEVICFPVKVEAGSAGWTRAVAVVEE